MNSASEATTGVRVEVTNLTYRYPRAAAPSLDGFTTAFGPGVTGLVGPNGAGKTTFMRLTAGLLTPDGGELRVSRQSIGEFLRGGRIGFLPEDVRLPAYLTVDEFLEGVEAAVDAGAAGSWRGELGPLLGQRCTDVSLGQRKRIALEGARMGRPPLLLLDEPTNGLDPGAVQWFRSEIRGEADRGATVLVSSHHLDELQRIADRVLFVREGRLLRAVDRASEPQAFEDLDRLFTELFMGGAA